MCLLFYKPADVTFDEEVLRDFFTRNKDGYGVMYADKDGDVPVLCMDKGLGGVDDWVQFYKKHEKREAFFHLRMATHGDVDRTNCHPYPVCAFEPGWENDKMPILMMHNGILRTGNSKDTKKSDTWHYVRDYIRPIAEHNPGFIFTEQFKDMLESHIGSSNKFALLDAHGNKLIVNRRAGVEWKGAWLSNTYAWSHHKFAGGSTYSGYQGGYNGSVSGGHYSGGGSWGPDWGWEEVHHNGNVTKRWVKNPRKDAGNAVTPSQAKLALDVIKDSSTKVIDVTKAIDKKMRKTKVDSRFYVETRVMLAHINEKDGYAFSQITPAMLRKAFDVAGPKLVFAAWESYIGTSDIRQDEFLAYMRRPEDLKEDEEIFLSFFSKAEPEDPNADVLNDPALDATLPAPAEAVAEMPEDTKPVEVKQDVVPITEAVIDNPTNAQMNQAIEEMYADYPYVPYLM